MPIRSNSDEQLKELLSKHIRTILKVSPIFTYVIFILIMLTKAALFDFEYYPVLDDFIQYHANTLYENPFTDMIMKAGLLNGRPLAAVTDLYFWSGFWDNMKTANVIITMLHALSGILIYRLFERHYNATPVFLFIYGLFPIGSEAVNWLSASTRIIVPLFLLGIALNLLQGAFDVKKIPAKVILIALGMIFLTASMCYYEQIAILSVIMTCGLIVSNDKGVLYNLVVIVPLAAVLANYIVPVGNSINTERVNLVDMYALPSALNHHFEYAGDKIGFAMFDVSYDMVTKAFQNGWSIITNENNSYAFLVLILAFVLVWINILFHSGKQRIALYDDAPNVLVLLYALILIAAPLVIFMIIVSPWVSMRNIFPSVIGFALFVDMVLKWVVYIRPIRATIIALCCVCFITANFGELSDYRAVGMTDRYIAENTAEAIRAEEKPMDTIVVLNTKTAYVNVAVPYNEHINSVTSSEWAYEGAVAAVMETRDIPKIYPIREGIIDKTYPELNIDDIDAYYYMDESFKLHKLKAIPYKENFSLQMDGKTIAELIRWEYKEPHIEMVDGN